MKEIKIEKKVIKPKFSAESYTKSILFIDDVEIPFTGAMRMRGMNGDLSLQVEINISKYNIIREKDVTRIIKKD